VRRFRLKRNAAAKQTISVGVMVSRTMTPQRRRTVFLIVSALIAVLVCLLANDVMLPIVMGGVVAYVILPIVRAFEKRRVPRPLAIVMTYLILIGSLAIFIRVTFHRIALETQSFVREVPELMTRARDQWIPVVESRIRAMHGGAPTNVPEATKEDDAKEEAFRIHPNPDGTFGLDIENGLHVRHARDGFVIAGKAKTEPFDVDTFFADSLASSLEYARSNAFELARLGGRFVETVSRVIFVFGLTLMVGAYIILTKEKIAAFFLSLARPSSRADLRELGHRVDHGLSGVVRGQLVICLINGVLTAIGLGIFGVHYWPLLAILATIFSLVPIFGALASAIPAVALGLAQGPSTAVFVLCWIVGVHQVEANLLNPKIMGDSAKIHPVLVIFSLLVGEHFFHIVGALLAVPTMSVAQTLFLFLREKFDAEDPEFSPHFEQGAIAQDPAAR
jgi:predicted PurR-regulated permease PerM